MAKVTIEAEEQDRIAKDKLLEKERRKIDAKLEKSKEEGKKSAEHLATVELLYGEIKKWKNKYKNLRRNVNEHMENLAATLSSEDEEEDGDD